MSALELVADTLLVVGLGLLVAAAATVSVTLALLVGGVLCTVAGVVGTAFALRRPKRPAGVVDRGPFEAEA